MCVCVCLGVLDCTGNSQRRGVSQKGVPAGDTKLDMGSGIGRDKVLQKTLLSRIASVLREGEWAHVCRC